MSEPKPTNEVAPTGARFTDALGREWQLRITVADLPVLRELGLMHDPLKAIEWIAKASFSEPEKLVVAAYRVGRADCAPEAFAAGFDGAALMRLVSALSHAVIDFFPDPTVAAELRSILNTKLYPTPNQNPSTSNASAGNWRESSG
jgi:hypothetical protein